MVFKLTDLENVSTFAGLVWKADFLNFFGNILGLGAYFSKPILRWNRESELVDMNTMDPKIQTIFFHL